MGVRHGDGEGDPLGQTDVDPPLGALAAEALQAGSTATDTFAESGNEYLVDAQRLPGSPLVLVAVSARHDIDRGVAQLRLRILAAAAAAVVATSLAAAGVASSSLRPIRRAALQQREFLANAAHELRTPLSVIRASAAHALGGARTADEQWRALAEILAAAERASGGVADLLDLARLEAGQTVLRRGPMRLDLLVEEVVAEAAPAAPAATVATGHLDVVVVDADYDLLRRAVSNVVANAARRATRVVASVHLDAESAIVEVADDGPGFDPAVLPHAFDRFRRDADPSAGSGLGLAIVREVAEVHGGGASAGNGSGLGAATGAVVRITLPLRAPTRRRRWARRRHAGTAHAARR